ncbi:BGTF surface domain-containing protein [Natrialbaceae archaeon A-CW3]
MTGTKQKVSSALMAVLMVLSVVAIGGAAFAGAAAAANHADDTTTKDDLGGVYFAGQTVEVTGFDDNERIELREGDDDSSTWVTNLNADEDGNVTVDTSDLDGSEYILRNDSNENFGPFEINVQEVAFAFDADEVSAEGSANLVFEDDNRADEVDIVISEETLSAEEINATFDGSEIVEEDGEEIVVVEGVSEGDDVEASFGSVDAGDYEFVVSVADTTAEDTAPITVGEELDFATGFSEDVYENEVGDVAEFTVEIEGGESAYVEIADEYDFYEANFTVNDEEGDGEVTVYFDTFAAAQDGDDGDVFWANGDNDVDNVNEALDGNESGTLEGDRLLDGEYELEVFPSSDAEDEDDIAFLLLGERSTGDMTTYIASGDLDVSELDAEDVPEHLTERDSVAEGDYLVTQVDASGVYAYLEAGLEDEEHGLDFTVSSTDDPAYGDAPFASISEHYDDGMYVVPDAENNQFYVFVDTGADLGDDGDLELGEWDVEFTISDDNPYVDDEDGESASQVVTAEEPEFELVGDIDGDDVLHVEQSDEATIAGETNVAPGADVDYRLRFSETVMRGSATVDDDGTFADSFDLSERAVDDEFTIRNRMSGVEDLHTDAVVAEAEPEPEGPAWAADVTAPEDATEGDDLDFSVDLANNGDEEGTTDVVLTVGDEDVIDEEVTVEAGASTTLEGTLADAAAGDVEWDLYVGDDHADSGTVSVAEDVDDDEADDDDVDDDEADDDDVDDDDADDDDADDDDVDDDDAVDDDADDDDDVVDDDADDDDDDDDDGQPGFGVAVALAALLGAAMLALRRQD